MENTGINVLNTPSPSITLLTNWKLWLLTLLTIIMLALVGLYMNYKSYATSPWWSDRYKASSWFKDLMTTKSNNLDTHIVQQIVEDRKIDNKEIDNKEIDIRETWCLVGEDLSGRYCVRVPEPQSCTHERSFLTKDQCELTPAMHLPAGIQANHSTTLLR